MVQSLLLSVRFHDGRYHGAGDWPPAPARLFQALVAGAAKGAELSDTDKAALEWLEVLEAPVIAVPASRKGQSFGNFVPNNDLDAVGGDPRRIDKLRTEKNIRPHIFNTEIPLLFIWTFNSGATDEGRARTVCRMAEKLYQLGRGVDMAWAWAEILGESEIAEHLARYGGVVYRPSKGVNGTALLCPRKGSLTSLKERYYANMTRFSYIKEGKKVQQLFSQPPKPRFAKILYNVPPCRLLFELRTVTGDESFMPWPPVRIAEIVVKLRDKVVGRLKDALPEEAGKIDRVFIGRGATEADKAVRVRIVPLPSIGHIHADHAIRRLLVEVPPNCPLRVDDIAWAFSGLEEIDQSTGEILWNLVRTEEHKMLDHFGIGDSERNGFHLWRTITPAALPVMRTGRRTKGARRAASEAKTARAVGQALRHVGVTTPATSIRVQREPFDRNGARAEEFAMPERFMARGLHHVEIAFSQAVRGPLVIGNGRYLGLGLMAPEKDSLGDVLVCPIASKTSIANKDAAPLLHGVRRALMALSRDDNNHVPRLFSGHEPDSTPARSGGHEHVFLAADDADGDGLIDRLIVAAPWACDHTSRGSRKARACFDRVVMELVEVRAGRLGVISLGSAHLLEAGDPLVGPARKWGSRTPYRPTRHARRGKELDAVVMRDVMDECKRRGLPKPEVELLECNAGPNGGNLAARLRLCFAVAVEGPIMLGRDSHSGGGLFSVMNQSKEPYDDEQHE